MVCWNCDICGEATYINPTSEPLWDEHKLEVSVPFTEDEIGEDGQKRKVLKYKVETQITRVPKLTHMKRQNAQTGVIEEVPVQDVKDLQPRAYIIRLTVGAESIQKDFCKKCLQTVMPQIQALWDGLAKIKDK